MAEIRKEAGAPLGSAADRMLAHYSPRGPIHEAVPSGAPKDSQPFASNWFLLVVLAAGILLLFLALYVIYSP